MIKPEVIYEGIIVFKPTMHNAHPKLCNIQNHILDAHTVAESLSIILK